MKHLLLITSIVILAACGSNSDLNSNACFDNSDSIQWSELLNSNAPFLSDYGLFSDSSNPTNTPTNPGISYEINSSLFTDHASKYRFIFIPSNCQAEYDSKNAFDFPIGTTLVKTFSMPFNTSHVGIENEALLEVRLLIRRTSGWVTLPYVWNSNLKDGVLSVVGGTKSISITHSDQTLTSQYLLPTPGECRQCHEDNGIATPIGLKARHLNKNIQYQNQTVNQLLLWKELNMLSGVPDDLTAIDTAPDWKDETQPIQNRAKAYLDINCSHCHSEGGAGALSGLRLEYWRKSIDYNHGVCNSSHGWRGGGFDIWPGDGANSSIPIRMRHTSPTDRMPPLGRSLIDEDAAQLISNWIDTLPYQVCSE